MISCRADGVFLFPGYEGHRHGSARAFSIREPVNRTQRHRDRRVHWSQIAWLLELADQEVALPCREAQPRRSMGESIAREEYPKQMMANADQ